MKDAIIILSFIALIAGGILSCSTAKDNVELKPVWAVFVSSNEKSRYDHEANRYKERLVFVYDGDNGIQYEVEYYLGDRVILYVPR